MDEFGTMLVLGPTDELLEMIGDIYRHPTTPDTLRTYIRFEFARRYGRDLDWRAFLITKPIPKNDGLGQ